MKHASEGPILTGEVAGHTLTVLVNGTARFEELIGLVDNAAISLRLFYYMIVDDAHGRALRDALLGALQRGVSVTLMVDGFGSNTLGSGYFDPLLAAGARCARFHANWGRRYLLRNHQKIAIADGAVALIGGANISSDYFVSGETGKGWHDLTLRIEGDAVGQLAAYYDDLRDWVGSERLGMRALQRMLTHHSGSTGAIRWLFGGPFQRMSPMTRALRFDLDCARRVSMIQAYFSPNWSFLRRLGRVARRGELSLITAAHSDNATTIGAARHCYPRLLKRGAHIHEFGPARLHMKMIVLDDVVWIGSANFDMRSLFINVEIMLRIEDAGFAKAMRDHVHKERSHSRLVSPYWLKEIAGPFRRLRWFLAYFLVSTVDYTITRRLNILPAPRRK